MPATTATCSADSTASAAERWLELTGGHDRRALGGKAAYWTLAPSTGRTASTTQASLRTLRSCSSISGSGCTRRARLGLLDAARILLGVDHEHPGRADQQVVDVSA